VAFVAFVHEDGADLFFKEVEMFAGEILSAGERCDSEIKKSGCEKSFRRNDHRLET
jgi:hypothetical protein